MASLPSFDLAGLDEDYTEDEMDNILGLLTPPALFHGENSQQPIPSTNINILELSTHSPMPSTNLEELKDLSQIPVKFELESIPSQYKNFDSQSSSVCIVSQSQTQNLEINESLSMEFQSSATEESFKVQDSQRQHIELDTFEALNFDQNNERIEELDPVLEKIKREFETPSSQAISEEIKETFELDDDLEFEFSQPCSSEMFSTTLEPSQRSTHTEAPQKPTEPTKESSFPADTTLIPLSVSKLFDQITSTYSDFSFVFALAAQMCQELLPMDSFIHLKIGLLLSLASINPDSENLPISIIALGKESSCANILMTNIGNAARRLLCPTEDFHTGIVKDDFVKFGPLQLARTGVCYLGNWSRLKPQLSDKLFKALETGKLIIEGSNMTMPLQCSVWSYWNAYKHNSKDQQDFIKFFEIFGIPIVLEDRTDEDLVDFMLKQAMISPEEQLLDELAIPLEELKMFLDVISRRNVDFTKKASDILQSYFVVSRTDRPDCLTAQAFSTIKQMAESFAKLSCRHEVKAIDSIAAIFMVEDVINHAFGAGVNPPPKFSSFSCIEEVDDYMNSFQSWLLKYLNKY